MLIFCFLHQSLCIGALERPCQYNERAVRQPFAHSNPLNNGIWEQHNAKSVGQNMFPFVLAPRMKHDWLVRCTLQLLARAG